VVVRGCYLCVIFLLLRWEPLQTLLHARDLSRRNTAVFCARELYALDILTLVYPLSPPSRPCPPVTAIQKLSLASNNLRGLPDEIAACTTLEELYLSNNAKFSYFPGSAGHLRWTFLAFALHLCGVCGFYCAVAGFLVSFP
jgi:hypothetical protein